MTTRKEIETRTVSIVEKCIVVAYECYDAGNIVGAMTAMQLAIKSAGLDRFWLGECKKHMDWLTAGMKGTN